MGEHPSRHEGATSTDDPRDPRLYERQMLKQNAGMNRHIVHALLSLVRNHVDHIVSVELFDGIHTCDRLIERDGADRNRTGRDDSMADFVDAAARAQVHDRIGPVLYGQLQLSQLLIDVGDQGGVADIGVDLDAGHRPDPYRLEAGVMNIARDNESTAGYLGSDQLGIESFPLCDVGHLRSDNPLAGIVHLRNAVPITVSRPCNHVSPLPRKAKNAGKMRPALHVNLFRMLPTLA